MLHQEYFQLRMTRKSIYLFYKVRVKTSFKLLVVQGSGPIGQDKINPFTLQFSSSEVENKFKRTFLLLWIRWQRYFHLMSVVCYDFFFLVTYLAQGDIEFRAFFILFGLSFMIQFVTAWFLLTKKYEKHFYFVNGLTVMVRLATKTIYDVI